MGSVLRTEARPFRFRQRTSELHPNPPNRRASDHSSQRRRRRNRCGRKSPHHRLRLAANGNRWSSVPSSRKSCTNLNESCHRSRLPEVSAWRPHTSQRAPLTRILLLGKVVYVVHWEGFDRPTDYSREVAKRVETGPAFAKVYQAYQDRTEVPPQSARVY